jgi:hypothetical protein
MSYLKLKDMAKYLIVDCYGDVYEVDDLKEFVNEWYGGELSEEEGMEKIFKDCKITKIN